MPLGGSDSGLAHSQLSFPTFSESKEANSTAFCVTLIRITCKPLWSGGVLGFLLWAVLIGGGIVRAIVDLRSDPRSVTREQGMWIALCALSLIGVLIHSLVDFPLQIASLQLIAAVLLGQLWARPPRKTARPGNGRPFQPVPLA